MRTDSRWFNGPSFLRKCESNWPKEENFFNNIEDDRNEYIKQFKCVNCIFSNQNNIIESSRFSSWNRLLFSVVRVLEAVDLWKSKIKKRFKNNPSLQIKRTFLDRLLKAEEICIQLSQYDSFHEEIHDLKKLNQVAKNSRILNLNPELNATGNLISNSRLVNFDLSGFETKPIILDAKNHITKLLIKYYHFKFYHASHNTVINELNKKYCIVGLRKGLRSLVSKCIVCKILRAQPSNPKMAALPPARLGFRMRPFTHTGLDFFGPMHVRFSQRCRKNGRREKM